MNRTRFARAASAVALAATLTLLTGALAVTAGCGSSGASGSSSPSASSTKLTVFAAASLDKVFPQIAAAFRQSHPGVTVTFNFAGTDTLATQIEQGAPADVFAGASTKFGDELFGKGLIDTPQIFATNALVVVVPAADPAHLSSLRDLAKPGVKLVIGDATVPIGAYTRKVLGNLDAVYGAGYSAEVTRNVVSETLDVTSILTAVSLGNADAGFVYVTDARSAGDHVKTIALPAAAQAIASYPIGVVKASKSAATAQQFAAFVLGPQAQAILRAAGFAAPPA
jgi:molybdate transport system substrate-binding protein